MVSEANPARVNSGMKLYKQLDRSTRKELLRLLVKRIVVEPQGNITSVKLLAPFEYLQELSSKVARLVIKRRMQLPAKRRVVVRTVSNQVNLIGI